MKITFYRLCVWNPASGLLQIGVNWKNVNDVTIFRMTSSSIFFDVVLFEVIWLMTMKMMLNMKNRSYRYDINRPRPRNRHKYTKYKMCLSIMMAICIKQHLSNIWSSIHEQVKQNWGWVEKKCCLYKKNVYLYQNLGLTGYN